MFLEKYKSRGNEYYRLVENFKYVSESDGKTRYHKKLIYSLGNAKNYSYTFDEIRDNFKNGIALIPELEKYLKDFKRKVNISLNEDDTVSEKNVGYLILDRLFKELELDKVFTLEKSRRKLKYDALGLARLLVFNRFLKPCSKIKTFENKDLFLSEITTSENFRDIYEVLDIFNEKKNKIIKSMNKNIEKKIGRKHDFLYYDVTNYYFEIDQKDPDVIDEETGEVTKYGLRKPGVSKEKRKDPIIQMGMFLDSNSIPVSYELFKGNTLDKQTLGPMLNSKDIDIKDKKVLVIADRGMVNGGNEITIKKSGNDYLFAKGVRQSNKEVKIWVTNGEDYDTSNPNFKFKSKIMERVSIDKETGKREKIKEKVLVFWSRKYYDREMNERKSFLETLNKYIENPNSIVSGKKKGLDRYVVVDQASEDTGELVKTVEIRSIDEEKLKEEEKYMGYYLLVTSDLESDDKEMIKNYRGLTQIENCFRITKSELQARPVFCSTEEHIRGHFVVCYIALTMMRILQNKVIKYENKEAENVWREGISAKRLQKALNEFNTSIIKDWCMFKEKEKNEDLTKLLSSLGIAFDFNILKDSEIRTKMRFSL